MSRIRSVFIVVAVACAATAVACADLFHSTDSPTLCDVDAAAPGCSTTTDDAGLTDLCAPDHATAEKRAMHACAWLAACENPVGKNATGECMVEAIQAYDCAANPNRRPKLEAKVFWSKLVTVASCDAVDKAALPDGVGNCPPTPGGFIGCTKQVANGFARIQCANPSQRYYGESCALQGRNCDSFPITADGGGNNGALCLGAKGRACTASGCDGAHLAACDDGGIDRGLDCSYFGSGECVVTGAQPACKPDQPVAKPASKDITCTSGGAAEATASGFLESVDCTYISGSAPDNCVPIPNAPPGTAAAAACRRSAGCSTDSCSAGKLVACLHGRSVTVDCVGDGLKACNDAVNTLEGPKAACGRP